MIEKEIELYTTIDGKCPLSELRFNFGKGYRIYFKELDNVVILIIAGSDKSNQKTVIKQANMYLKEYLSRGNKNEYKI